MRLILNVPVVYLFPSKMWNALPLTPEHFWRWSSSSPTLFVHSIEGWSLIMFKIKDDNCNEQLLLPAQLCRCLHNKQTCEVLIPRLRKHWYRVCKTKTGKIRSSSGNFFTFSTCFTCLVCLCFLYFLIVQLYITVRSSVIWA